MPDDEIGREQEDDGVKDAADHATPASESAVEARRLIQVVPSGGTVDAAQQAGEHVPWPHLDEAFHPASQHAFHRFGPAHARGELCGQVGADVIRMAQLGGLDVANNAHPGNLDAGLGQRQVEAFLGCFHQRRVGGDAHRQADHLPRAGFLQQRRDLVQAGLVAGDDDLSRAVVVGDPHAVPVRACTLAGLIDRLDVQAKHGSHAAGADLAGELHGLGSCLYEAQGALEIERPAGYQGRKLAQGMAGDECGLEAREAGLEDLEHGHAVREQSRLRVQGLIERVHRTLPAELGKRITEQRIGLFEDVRGERLFLHKHGSHAEGLGSLSGEEQCGFLRLDGHGNRQTPHARGLHWEAGASCFRFPSLPGLHNARSWGTCDGEDVFHRSWCTRSGCARAANHAHAGDRGDL